MNRPACNPASEAAGTTFDGLLAQGVPPGAAAFTPVAVRLPDGNAGQMSPVAGCLWRALARGMTDVTGGLDAVPTGLRRTLEKMPLQDPRWEAGSPSVRGLWLLLDACGGGAMDWGMTFSPDAWLIQRLGGRADAGQIEAARKALIDTYFLVAPCLDGATRQGFDERLRRGIFHHLRALDGHSAATRQWRVERLLAFPPPAGEEDSTLQYGLFPLVCDDIACGELLGSIEVRDGGAFARAAAKYLARSGVAQGPWTLLAMTRMAGAAAPEGLQAFGIEGPLDCLPEGHGWADDAGWWRRLGEVSLAAIYEAQAWHDAGGHEGPCCARAGDLWIGVSPKVEAWQPAPEEAAATAEVGARLFDCRWRTLGRPGGVFKYSRDYMDNTARLFRAFDLTLAHGRAPSAAARAAFGRFVDEAMGFRGGRALLAGAWLRWLRADAAAHPARLLEQMGLGIDDAALLGAVNTPGHRGSADDRARAATAHAAWRLEGRDVAIQHGRRRRA